MGTQKDEYNQFMKDSATDKQQKQTEIDNLSAKKDDNSQSLEEKKADLMGTQKELAAGLEYYEKMKPQCIEQGVSFEDRVARRKEEIDSLKQALPFSRESRLREGRRTIPTEATAT